MPAADDPADQKVILITGGARRVGAAIARMLHASGASIMLHYRSSVNEARQLQAELNEARPDSVALVQAELLNGSLVPSIVSETVSRFGRLDVLINNAAGNFIVQAEELSPNGFRSVVDIVLNGTFLWSRAAGRHWL